MLILWNCNNDSFIYTALLKQVYLGKLKKRKIFTRLLLQDNWESQFKWVRWPVWSQKMAYIIECSGSISLQGNQKAKAAKAANLF